jgi:hypothetical protein
MKIMILFDQVFGALLFVEYDAYTFKQHAFWDLNWNRATLLKGFLFPGYCENSLASECDNAKSNFLENYITST